MKHILSNLVKEEVSRLITIEKIRPDGRKPDEIRPLASETHTLTKNTWIRIIYTWTNSSIKHLYIGALGDVQILDGLVLEETKRFMHHYNFPHFSVGETGFMRGPGRREIGHGALGERALRTGHS